MYSVIETMRNIVEELNICNGPNELINLSKKDLLEKITGATDLATTGWLQKQNLDLETLCSMDDNGLGKKMSELLIVVKGGNKHDNRDEIERE